MPSAAAASSPVRSSSPSRITMAVLIVAVGRPCHRVESCSVLRNQYKSTIINLRQPKRTFAQTRGGRTWTRHGRRVSRMSSRRDRRCARSTARRGGLSTPATRSGVSRRGAPLRGGGGPPGFARLPARAAAHAARFLYLLNGREPSPEVARTMDVVLTLHADHEFNASTFAARVAVATMADLHAAIVSAIATLKGPRHGGANDDVLAMLHQIEDPARAEAFVEARIGGRAGMAKRERSNPTTRMPGFGHRVYKVDDARARVLRGMAKEMAAATGRERLFEVAEGVYGAMRARTTLPVNVDFFSAVVHDALGIAPDLCTSIFAVGRIAGWCAHALEQYADNRLIRPRADYVGSAPRALATAAG